MNQTDLEDKVTAPLLCLCNMASPESQEWGVEIKCMFGLKVQKTDIHTRAS